MASPAPTDIVGHLPEPAARAVELLAPQTWHAPSFVMGAGAMLVVVVLLLMVIRRGSRMIIAVLGMAALGALGAGYFAYIRNQIGLPMVNPASVVDEARSAAGAMQKQLDKQGAALKQIEERP